MNPHNHQQQQPLAPLVIVNSSTSSSSSANSLLKTRFALRFLQSLKKINNTRHRTTNHSPTTSSLPSSSHPKKSNLITTRKRSKRVKIAADASMASLIGSRRVWSRAVISNLRRNHTTSMKTAPDATTTQKLRKNKIKKKKKTVGLRKRKVVVASGGGGRESQLRNLVPGGNEMDSCTLLDETAHYIQCLATQVMVMRNIVDYCSPSPP